MPELRGKMYVKKDTQIITDAFKKREFVVETIEQYPQKIPLQVTNERTSLLDNFKIGQEVVIMFNYRGTEYKKDGEEAKYFLTLDAWKIV